MTYRFTSIPSVCSLCNIAATHWLVDENSRILARCETHLPGSNSHFRRWTVVNSIKEVEVLLIHLG